MNVSPIRSPKGMHGKMSRNTPNWVCKEDGRIIPSVDDFVSIRIERGVIFRTGYSNADPAQNRRRAVAQESLDLVTRALLPGFPCRNRTPAGVSPDLVCDFDGEEPCGKACPRKDVLSPDKVVFGKPRSSSRGYREILHP